MSKHLGRVSLLIVIVLLGFGLRLYQLDALAFRGDEAFSVQRWATTPLSQSLTEIASLEPHPPLTYIIFRGWGNLFSPTNEFALRLLPVFVNILGIAGMFALAKRLSKSQAIAITSALLWAIHPFQIWHAQDFRNYGIWAGLSVIVLWLAIRIINTQSRDWRAWLTYWLIALVSCLIFYNELITIGVLGLYVLVFYRKHPKFVLRWSLANGAIITLTILTFVIFQGDLLTGGGYAGTTGGFQIEQWWQRFIPVLQFGDTLSLSLQQQFNPTTNWWISILIYTLLLMTYVAYERPHDSIFIIMIALLPLLVLGIISVPLRIFRPRYIMLAIPAYILLISYATVLLWRTNATLKILSGLVLGIWLIVSGISLNNYYHDSAYAKTSDWRVLIDFLENYVENDDIVIQTSVDAAFGLYFEQSDVLADEFALPINFDQSIDEIITTMESTAQEYQTLWILGQTFPDWQNAGVVENWAFDNLQLIQEADFAGLPVRQFMDWQVTPDELDDVPITIFDDAIALRGIEIQQIDFTNTLLVIIYWEALETTTVPLTVFVQLIGDINPATGTPLWAQDDHPPQQGRINTDSWETGQVYRDVYRLSLTDVVAGDYSLLLGFYDPNTGERLIQEDGTDAFELENSVIE
ncbi:MAG: hypothetical protein AAFV93_16125 [Chloroflexota bacterium]